MVCHDVRANPAMVWHHPTWHISCSWNPATTHPKCKKQILISWKLAGQITQENPNQQGHCGLLTRTSAVAIIFLCFELKKQMGDLNGHRQLNVLKLQASSVWKPFSCVVRSPRSKENIGLPAWVLWGSLKAETRIHTVDRACWKTVNGPTCPQSGHHIHSPAHFLSLGPEALIFLSSSKFWWTVTCVFNKPRTRKECILFNQYILDPRRQRVRETLPSVVSKFGLTLNKKNITWQQFYNEIPVLHNKKCSVYSC